MSIQTYSFKIIVHEVTIQAPANQTVFLTCPQVSICIGTFPRIMIKGKHPISTVIQKMPAFGNGKSVILQMSPEKILNVIAEHQLEAILLNENKILAGARISLKSFGQDIDQENPKFRRGSFHLLDQAGQPYALLDMSICIHKYQQQNENHYQQQEQQQQEMQHFSQIYQQHQDDPKPQEITFNSKNHRPQSKNKDSKNVSIILEAKQQEKTLNNTKLSNKYSRKSEDQMPTPSIQQQKPKQSVIPQQNLQTFSKPQFNQPQSTYEQEPYSQQYQQNQPFDVNFQSQSSGVIDESTQDISILDWVNGFHCPPPLILDKKMYYDDYAQPKPIQYIPQKKQDPIIQYPTRVSMAVQTDEQTMITPRDVKQPSRQSLQDDKSNYRTKTNQSDEYPEDFESVAQSQQFVTSTQSLKKNISLSSLTQQSPRIGGQFKKHKSYNYNEVEEEIYEEVYQDDFESVSGSIRKSQSLEKLNSRRRLTEDQISESYIQDFESISQSQFSVSRPKKYGLN